MGHGEGQGEGEGHGADGGSILWAIIWVLLFIFVSFWVAWFCAWWYIILFIFTVCIDGVTPITDLLLQGIQFPKICVENTMNMKPLC